MRARRVSRHIHPLPTGEGAQNYLLCKASERGGDFGRRPFSRESAVFQLTAVNIEVCEAQLEVKRCNVGGRDLEFWRSRGATEQLKGAAMEVGRCNGAVQGCNVGGREVQRCSSKAQRWRLRVQRCSSKVKRWRWGSATVQFKGATLEVGGGTFQLGGGAPDSRSRRFGGVEPPPHTGRRSRRNLMLGGGDGVGELMAVRIRN